MKDYAKHRSEPARDPSSRLSAYFSAGIISVREALTAAKSHNGGADLDGSGDEGIASWTRELVFREFYRQMLVAIPHNAMNLPQNLKFDFVQWEDDEAGWRKWCEGKTGVPFVDAGMRQLNTVSQPFSFFAPSLRRLPCPIIVCSRGGFFFVP